MKLLANIAYHHHPDLTPNMWREWNGKTYVSLPYYINYHAFWMFSTKRLAEILGRNP